MKTRMPGFTLVELVIVVGVIGLLATIMVPSYLNYLNAAKRTSCICNLVLIERSKDQFMVDSGGVTSTVPTWVDILPYIKNGADSLYCPAAPLSLRTYSNCYRINQAGTDPVCLMRPVQDGLPAHSLRFRPR